MHRNIPRKYYFISKFDTKNIDYQTKDTGIIFRNYNSKNQLNTIINVQKYCKKKGCKFYLSNDVKLAINLGLDGAYIPSFNRNTNHLSYSMNEKFLIIGSAHNNKEMKIKEKQGVKVIFLSSIFKKNKNYLGINKFKLFSKFTNKKIIALGGVSSKNLKMLKLLNCFGFAGISLFKKKTAPKGRL